MVLKPVKSTKITVFKGKQIRRQWDKKQEKWYFSVIDVVEALTDSVNPRDYWFKMKIRVKNDDGVELSTICRQLKLESSDGKKYQTDVADTEGIFRIIQSIPSPKAEPFKRWLAKLSTRQIAETVKAKGLTENKPPAHKGGRIAKHARLELEKKTGKSVVTRVNFLAAVNEVKRLGQHG